MPVELRDLQYFAAIVEHASLTRAATSLRVSQPTLTHAVARIEQALGGAVWERLRNRRAGVIPTELGKRVLERGQRATTELSALEQDAALLRGLKTGTLRVGTNQSLAATLLPRWIARFASAHPRIALDLPLVTSEEAAQQVTQGVLDAALVTGALPSAGLRRLRCGEQELVAVVRADHALAKQTEIALAALHDDPFVLVPSGTFAALAIEDVCRRAGFVPDVRCRLASLSGLCALVRFGIGVSVLPEGSVPPGDRELRALRLRGSAARRAVHLLYRDAAQPSPALSAWIATGKEIIEADAHAATKPRLRK
jgi:DNA-binding transcriptional LysR family regulator